MFLRILLPTQEAAAQFRENKIPSEENCAFCPLGILSPKIFITSGKYWHCFTSYILIMYYSSNPRCQNHVKAKPWCHDDFISNWSPFCNTSSVNLRKRNIFEQFSISCFIEVPLNKWEMQESWYSVYSTAKQCMIKSTRMLSCLGWQMTTFSGFCTSYVKNYSILRKTGPNWNLHFWQHWWK